MAIKQEVHIDDFIDYILKRQFRRSEEVARQPTPKQKPETHKTGP